MGKYDPEKKREYYLENREKRLAYQNQYYRDTGYRRKRRQELEEYFEPEQYMEAKKRLSEYNKRYYRENRDRILAQRKARQKSR